VVLKGTITQLVDPIGPGARFLRDVGCELRCGGGAIKSASAREVVPTPRPSPQLAGPRDKCEGPPATR
jgi:hypothetical protein